MTTKKAWYAVYTKPRFEKKVHQFFQIKGIESYCPLNKVRKKWSDRYKVVEEPLFKSYVFVKLAETEKAGVRMTEGVVNFVYWLGRPAVINELEIITIKKFLKEYEYVKAEKLDIQKGQKVKITAGLFMDKQGVVIKTSKNKVFVVLDSIGYRLMAELDPQDVDTL